MAIVLDTELKVDGKTYEEGTPLSDLPRKVAKIAKDANGGAGILVQRTDPSELEAAIAELEDDEDEEDEDE